VRRGVIDFVELGEAARGGPAARTPADLALSLGEAIQHLLVDEFQDTSVSQFGSSSGWWRMGCFRRSGRCSPWRSDAVHLSVPRSEVGLFLRTRAAGVGAVSCESLCA
jgi:hypothetical protein